MSSVSWGSRSERPPPLSEAALAAVRRTLGELPPRLWMILGERWCDAGQDVTLADLGRRMGVSRERARQLEVALRQRLARARLLPEIAPLVGWASQTLGVAAPADAPEVLQLARGTRDLGLGPVLGVLGPYRADDGWFVRLGEERALRSVAPALRDIAEPDGVLTWVLARRVLRPFGVLDPHIQRWMDERADGWCRAGLRWMRTDGGLADQLARALLLRDAPCTVEQLAPALPERRAAGSIVNVLGKDDRFMQVDRGRWALAAWGLTPYEGIAKAIMRLLRQHHRLSVLHLVEMITEDFDVSPNSVRTYTRAPAFVTDEDGFVRLRRSDEPYLPAEPPRDDATPHTWRIVVDDDVLRGSGGPLSETFVAALGLSPGERRELATSAGPLVVAWRATAITPYRGSVRRVVRSLGLDVGDALDLVWASEQQRLDVVAHPRRGTADGPPGGGSRGPGASDG